MKESKIESKACEKIFNGLGVRSIKMGFDGWPDRVFLLPLGRVVWIEFKRPGGVVRKRQRGRIKTLQAIGHWAALIDNKEEAFNYVRRALEAA